jgi:hypothetical protein
MSFASGPQVPTDEQGHAQAYGYVITGSEAEGYRGRAIVPLTASEVVYGVRELLFASDLQDLLILAKVELNVRSMVGQAVETARQDAQRARRADTQ